MSGMSKKANANGSVLTSTLPGLPKLLKSCKFLKHSCCTPASALPFLAWTTAKQGEGPCRALPIQWQHTATNTSVITPGGDYHHGAQANVTGRNGRLPLSSKTPAAPLQYTTVTQAAYCNVCHQCATASHTCRVCRTSSRQLVTLCCTGGHPCITTCHYCSLEHCTADGVAGNTSVCGCCGAHVGCSCDIYSGCSGAIHCWRTGQYVVQDPS